MQLAAGSLVADKYEVIKPLGRGGMGVVYLARQGAMERTVALKFLTCTMNQEDAIERFKREAKIMSNLKHRNLIASYELGIWQGLVYLAMEYVEGYPLQNEIDKGALKPDRVIEVARQIAEALSCAHAHGVVHRDLKPSNILITKSASGEEVIKVIDFGLAKLTSDFGTTVQKLTETGFAVGSVLYMAPEQCTAKGIDARSDIYGLGAVMYHCLTGTPPFDSDNSVALMASHLYETPKPLDIKDMPIGLDSIVFRCMAKEPGERYQSGEDFLRALNMVARGEGDNITSYVPEAVIATAQKEFSTLKEGKQRRSNPVKTVAISVMIMMLLFSLGGIVSGIMGIPVPQSAPVESSPEQSVTTNGLPAVILEYNRAIKANPTSPDFVQTAKAFRKYSDHQNAIQYTFAEFGKECRTIDDLLAILDDVRKDQLQSQDLLLPTKLEVRHDFYALAKCDLLLQQGKMLEAEKALKECSGDHRSKHVLAADISILNGHPGQALKDYSIGQGVNGPLYARAVLGEARARLELGRTEEIRNYLKFMAVPKDPEQAQSYRALRIRASISDNPSDMAFLRGDGLKIPMTAMTKYDVTKANRRVMSKGAVLLNTQKPATDNFESYP